MQEKVEELYQKYLSSRLDLIIESIKSENKTERNTTRVKPGYLHKHFSVLEIKNGYFNDGYTLVEDVELRRGMYNYIDKDGNLLGKVWFYDARNFEDGLAFVKTEKGWNFINTEGKIMCNHYFKEFSRFKDGYATVSIDGNMTYVDKNGKVILLKYIMQDLLYVFIGIRHIYLIV